MGTCVAVTKPPPPWIVSLPAGAHNFPDSILGGHQNLSATLSRMRVGVRDLRNDTVRVRDAVRAGEPVTLTVHGEPIADIVPHGGRTRWLSGATLRDQLGKRAADPALRNDLDELAGDTPADL